MRDAPLRPGESAGAPGSLPHHCQCRCRAALGYISSGRVAPVTTATQPPGKLRKARALSAFPSVQKNRSAFEGQTVAGGVYLRLASQQRGIEGQVSSCLAFPF